MTKIIKRDQAAGDARKCMTYIATLKDGNQYTIRAVDNAQAFSICKSAAELKRRVLGLFCVDTCDNLICNGKAV